jgi:hypothetical protein
MTKKRNYLFHAAFIVFCVSIFLFLWNAPPETTAKMPRDENHIPFYDLDRKVAEQKCDSCHQPEGISPLPVEHPPTFRCLFCHKKE